MNPLSITNSRRLTWRVFPLDEGRRVERQIMRRLTACCPRCSGVLEARPQTRLLRNVPLDATGYDLDCRGCRRFWCIVRHTPRSIRLVRMRRFVAALRAIELDAPAGAAA